MKIVSIISVFLLSFEYGFASDDDYFIEELYMNPMPNGFVHSHFQFSIFSNSNLLRSSGLYIYVSLSSNAHVNTGGLAYCHLKIHTGYSLSLSLCYGDFENEQFR